MPRARSTAGPSTPRLPPVRRGRISLVFAVALVLGAAGVWAAGSAAEAPGKPDARCIREGLALIPVTLRASVERQEGSGAPVLEVSWSGKPLAAGCHARRSVATDVELWFPHRISFSFTEGFPSPWQTFWVGRRAARNEQERYVSNAGYDGLGCIRKASGRLQYEVTAPGGAVVARRVVSAPVTTPGCPQ
jgi:hypothetical protein